MFLFSSSSTEIKFRLIFPLIIITSVSIIIVALPWLLVLEPIHQRGNKSEIIPKTIHYNSKYIRDHDITIQDLLTTAKTSLILPKLTWGEFDALVLTKPEVHAGKSFNGLNLSSISHNIPKRRGNYTTVIFVNHLDEEIDKLQVTGKWKSEYNNSAPYSILPHTKEIFTFGQPKLGGPISFTLSYNIPTKNVRIAINVLLSGFGLGLAFVPRNCTMTDSSAIFIMGMHTGSSAWSCCSFQNSNLTVGFKNVFARIFADDKGYGKAQLRIEVVELSR